MKQPAYHEREITTLQNADRVILRLFIASEWRKTEIFPDENEKMLDCVERVRLNIIEQTRFHFDLSKVIIYIGGQLGDEIGMVPIPRNYIPNQVRDILINKEKLNE